MSIQNLLQDIEKRRGTPKPSIQERATRIGKGTLEFIAPTRGYTQEEIKTAKPTLKEKFTGPAKVAGEIALGLASIGQFAMSKLPIVGKEYKKTLSPEYMARLQEKVQPKSAGEAQAMQFTDVATLGAGAVTKNIGREAFERIAKETDPVKIAGIVKDTVPQLADPNVLTRIAPNLAKTQDVNEVQKIIDVAIKSQPTSKAKLTPDVLTTEAKKYKSAEEFVKDYTQTHLMDLSNQGKHRWGRALDEFTNKESVANFLSGKSELGSLDSIKYDNPAVYKAVTAPGDTIKVYRAVPKSVKGLDVGDYVALERRYAQMHLDSVLKGEQKTDGKIIEMELPKTDVIWMGNDYAEWVYSPQKLRDEFPGGLTDIWKKANEAPIEEVAPKQGYKDTGELSTKLLGKLEGRTTVSKQFIADLTNSPDLKQAEKDLFRRLLEDEGDKVNVTEFANKVKAELLPLERKSLNKKPDSTDIFYGRGSGQAYENIALPSELRGNVKNYDENIYESPVTTSAGRVHFADKTDNYFGHTRVEDMADDTTRRVIEVQSDLYQKGRLEDENNIGFYKNMEVGNINPDVAKQIPEGDELIKLDKLVGMEGKRNLPTKTVKRWEELSEKAFTTVKEKRSTEVAKLAQYNDPTAHFRMIREEVKKAAEDGKTKLQFPTGETAMKIEGLGESTQWNLLTKDFADVRPLKMEDLKVGTQVGQGSTPWIITDVLGDGKFKAVPKKMVDDLKNAFTNETNETLLKKIKDEELLPRRQETFDISGKVDTNNPIYKFYEKEVGKYLKNKYNAQLVRDKQGVSWWEINVNKQMAKTPVEAFGVGAGVQQDEEGNYTINPTAAALGVAGIHGVKKLSKIDTLIAEGKVRVVSRDGRDVYQVKKGDNWINKRDEDSALKHFEPKPKPAVPEVAPELNERLVGLMVQKEMLDAMPEKQLAKFAAKTGEEKGTLREVTGQTTGKFANEGDQIVSDLGFESTEEAREAYVKYQNRVADITADIQNTKDAIKSAKQRAREQREIEKMQSDLVDTLTPKLGKTRAEVKSLEEVASRIYDELALPPTKMPLSLEEIVTQTPLKAKVNLLDYIRTPEKVLKKIGFADEAKLLRQKYDDYVVELPKNIDKITKWVDQVPKDANERIFQYLDGKDVQLYGNEQKIAEEIREYLKDWAVRLKLPEDKRITNYITHLFDEELIAKEFDEDLAKIIAEKIPGEVYDPFLQKRLGAQGYIQDVWMALDAYTKRATRKVHIDEALQKIQDKAGASLEFSNIEKSQFEYIKNYVDRVNMRPTRIDELLDTGIKQITGYKLGQRPINRISGLMRRVTYRGMLGANLGSALRNLSQGINTYAVLGERDFALGYMKLFSEKARNEMIEQGIFSNTFIQDRSISATKKALEKADKALWFFFDTAEKINRGAAYMGAKTKGLRKGMSEEEAIDYAKSIVRKTQFNYDSVDTPVALSSDLVKTLAQFQTYTVKQSEFLIELAADRNFGALARYVVGGLAFVYTIGQAFGMEEKELAPMFRFDGPPSLKFPIELAKAAFGTEDEYGNERDLEKKIRDVSKTLWGYVPGGMQLKKTIQGMEAVDEGASYDVAGRKQFEVGGTPAKDVQAILFGKYAGEEAKQYFEKGSGDKELDALKKEDNKAKAKERERVKEEVQNLRGGSKEEVKARLLELAQEDEAFAEKVIDALLEEKQGLSSTEKTLKNSTVKVRAEYIKSQMDDLDTDEEKKELLKEYAAKGILTESVLDEIINMKE